MEEKGLRTIAIDTWVIGPSFFVPDLSFEEVRRSADWKSEERGKIEEGVNRVQEILKAAKEVKEDVIGLAHGGPISSPEDTEYVYRHTDAVRFLGASSIERIPVEIAI